MEEYDIKNGLSLFWGGPYSQWTESVFRYKGLKFNCCEQWMMLLKALAHKDVFTALQVMQNTDPATQKFLGRQILNFSVDIWTEEVSMAVVYVGNYMKFTQNEDLSKYLLADPSETIVEASPYDKVWGIGLSADRPQAWNKNSWRGENRLGRCIDQVRLHLKDKQNKEALAYHEKAFAIVQEIINGR